VAWTSRGADRCRFAAGLLQVCVRKPQGRRRGRVTPCSGRHGPAVLAAAYDGAVVVDRHGFDGFALVVGQDPCDLSPPRQMAGLRPRLFGDAKDADLAGGCRDSALSAAVE
jgi:hypothetical protein